MMITDIEDRQYYKMFEYLNTKFEIFLYIKKYTLLFVYIHTYILKIKSNTVSPILEN